MNVGSYLFLLNILEIITYKWRSLHLSHWWSSKHPRPRWHRPTRSHHHRRPLSGHHPWGGLEWWTSHWTRWIPGRPRLYWRSLVLSISLLLNFCYQQSNQKQLIMSEQLEESGRLLLSGGEMKIRREIVFSLQVEVNHDLVYI